MKAITTRYYPPTRTHAGRIIASEPDGHRVIVPADGDFPYGDAHQAAAVKLCREKGWTGADTLIGGQVAGGEMVWVFPPLLRERDARGHHIVPMPPASNRTSISDELCDRLISELEIAANHIEGHGAYLDCAEALRGLALELHRTQDPHCTCNDCIAAHAAGSAR
jgi:hypothetical protein